ncbi:hypothetical protein [Lysinibacillus sp. NPDC086135]|uniref:hypothetical protein n=1 Tax=Lysinibacillus sp. NPDC086135 TaxID=3364130 RepID=UPI00381B4855
MIHQNQHSVPEWQLQWLREHPITNERATIELNDNRISLFVAQNGKCAVMGDELILTEMDCHHKTLWYETKDDRYVNLVLLSRDVHRLIHATSDETIRKYTDLIKPNDEQRNKINQLRKMVGNEAI